MSDFEQTDADKFSLPNTLLGVVSHEVQWKYRNLQLTNERVYKENEELKQELQDLLDQQKESKDFLNKKLKYCHDEIEQLKQANSEWETNYSQLQEQRESDLENLHEEYNETIAALKRKIQELEIQLEKLEEFKAQREELLQRNSELQELVQTAEEEHFIKLQEMDRKNIHERQKIKNGMLDRLRQTKEAIMEDVMGNVDVTVRRTIAENEHVVVELAYQSQQAEKLMKENERLLKENRELQIKNNLSDEHIDHVTQRSVLMKHALRESKRNHDSLFGSRIDEETLISNEEDEGDDEESVRTFTSINESKAPVKDRSVNSFLSEKRRAQSAKPTFQKHSSKIFDSVNKDAATKAQNIVQSVCSEIAAASESDPSLGKEVRQAIFDTLSQVRTKVKSENERRQGDVSNKVRPVQQESFYHSFTSAQADLSSEEKNQRRGNPQLLRRSLTAPSMQAIDRHAKGDESLANGSNQNMGPEYARTASVISDPLECISKNSSQHHSVSELSKTENQQYGSKRHSQGFSPHGPSNKDGTGRQRIKSKLQTTGRQVFPRQTSDMVIPSLSLVRGSKRRNMS